MSIGEAFKTMLASIPQLPSDPATAFSEGGLTPWIDAATVYARERAALLDPSKPKDRRAIVSLAADIAKTKGAIEDAGAAYAKHLKELPRIVDAERRRCKEAFDDLRDEIRAPVTEYEQREERRVRGHETAITQMAEFQCADRQMTVTECKANLAALGLLYGSREWEEFARQADKQRETVEYWLLQKLERAQKAEAEKAELERLRRESAERAEADRISRAEQEAAKRATEAAEAKAKAEADAIAHKAREAEQAAERERQRIERERQDAEVRADRAEKARIAAEQKAQREREEATERAEAASRKAEEDRKAAIEQERQRVAEARARDEKIERDRQAHKEHREKIEREATEALDAFLLGVNRRGDETGLSLAEQIIEEIGEGDIPHVRIVY